MLTLRDYQTEALAAIENAHERRGNMEGRFYEEVVREFDPLKSFQGNIRSGQLRVRVIVDGEGRRLFDVREFIESPNFSGWTKKGIRLDAKQLRVLVEALPGIWAALELRGEKNGG